MFVPTIFLVFLAIGTSLGQYEDGCGPEFYDCMGENIFRNDAYLDLMSTAAMNRGNLPGPLDGYRENVCKISEAVMSCAAEDSDPCYDDTLVNMNRPEDPSTVLTGSDGQSMHVMDDCGFE